MTDVDVLLTVEHVDRELDAVACVARMLEEHFDLRVEVRNFYADFPLIASRFRPAVLAVPFFYFKDHPPMQQYVELWPRARILNLAWEQILYAMNQSIKVPSDTFAKQGVRHVCWTKEYRAFLIERGVNEENLVWTGNPVMKFYDLPYRSYFPRREDLAARHGLDPRERWILFPENYRWGFLSDAQVENFVRLGGERSALVEARDYCRRSLATVLRWLARLCREPNVTVVVRPRPATGIEEVRAFATDVLGRLPPALRIIKDESAREWIMACDHVMSSYSTTLIEAALCGRPVHLVTPEPMPAGLHDEWYDKLPWICSEEEMVKAAGAAHGVRAEQTGLQLAQWARERLLGNGDPIRNIAVALAALHPRFAGADLAALLARTNQARVRAYRGPSLFARWMDEGRKRRMRNAGHHARLRARYPGYVFSPGKHEKDLFSSGEVRSRVVRWSSVDYAVRRR